MLEPLQCVVDAQGARAEVDVGPAQTQKLSLAQPERYREQVERFQAVVADGLQQASNLVGAERLDLMAGPLRGAHQGGDVAPDQAPSQGVVQSPS